MSAIHALPESNRAPVQPGAAENGQATVVALRWRTRDSTRHMLEAFIGGFGISLVTGVLLWLDVGGTDLAQVMLIVHLVAGTLGLFFFIPYVFAHIQDGKEPWLNLLFPFRLIPEIRWEPYAAKRLHGHLLMWANWLVLLSGVVLATPGALYLAGYPETLPYGASAWLLWIHDAFTVAILALMVFHFPRKDRK